MRRSGNTVRLLFGLTLTLVGLMSWNILTVDLVEAANRASLTTPPAQSASTAVANGRIAFVSRDVGSGTNFDIYTINADGSNRQQLTFGPVDDFEPAWSPDGTKIVFVRDNSSRAIYVMNADGSGQRRLTEPAANSGHYSPSWSPDGTKIAFGKYVSNGSANGSVIVMNADGSDQRTIFEGVFLHPSWSPDGLKLVGNRAFDGLVLINIDGSNLTYITQPPPFDPATFFADFEPSWLPDGSKIVFTRFVNCDINDCYTSRLYVVNSDGSNPTDLTRQDNFGYSPAWSPDGRKIVFGNGDLFVINPDGSGLTNLTNTNDWSESSPSWQPLSLTPTANPIDEPRFFVRQHYLDFLNREPDQDGIDYWTNEINKCGPDLLCINRRRVGISAAFFVEQEFNRTGGFIYRTFKTALGRPPSYVEFTQDRPMIIEGETLDATRAAYAAAFVRRAEFLQLYPPSISAEQFTDDLLNRVRQVSNVDLSSERGALIGMPNNDASRALALRTVADHPAVIQAEKNSSFVRMQYFGYLRRDPDAGGEAFWLDLLTNREVNNYLGMVCAFITSREYQERFSTAVTRSNADCANISP